MCIITTSSCPRSIHIFTLTISFIIPKDSFFISNSKCFIQEKKTSTLLRHNWQTKHVLFKVYNMIFWYRHTLWNSYHNQVNKHIHYFIFLCMWRGEVYLKFTRKIDLKFSHQHICTYIHTMVSMQRWWISYLVWV